MNKWIYIKSDRIIDAYVVASVLNDVSDTEFCLVRKMRFAKLFNKHPHILKSGFYENNNDSQLITINPTDTEDFKELSCLVAEKLAVENFDSYSMYKPIMPKVLDFGEVDIILMFSEELQEPLNLNFIDVAVNAFKTRQIAIISAGTMTIPCIRGCKDYRGLVTWEYLPLIVTQNKSVLIITNDPDYATFCKIVGLNHIFVQNEDETMYANNRTLNHPNELINLINQQIS